MILAFGFFTFFVALVYCVCICQESQHHRPGHPASVSGCYFPPHSQQYSVTSLISQGELYWTHHWQKNITIPEIRSRDKDRWEEQERFPEDDNNLSDTSSRDYPKLYLESDYGQRTDREADFETEQEAAGGKATTAGGGGGKYSGGGGRDEPVKGRL